MKPAFIGLGVQKSATSWIYRVLKEHPQVCMIKGELDKETMFFNYFYDRGFEWYERHWGGCNETEQGGEYSTSYFYNKEAPKRIFDYNPKMKLLVCLRDPIERAFSNHKHEIRARRVSGENIIFENALKNNPMYIYQSLYYTHLIHWLKFFPREQVLVLIYADIKKDPAQFVKHIYRFIGVNDRFKPSILTDRLNESRLPGNPGIESIIKSFSHIVRQIGFGWVIECAKRIGIKKAVESVNTKDQSLSFPAMKDETRDYLHSVFSEENRKLSELLCRNFGFWV